eukprot:gene19173-22919_t
MSGRQINLYSVLKASRMAALCPQTKFTHVNGQSATDIPYDPNVPVAQQVDQSFNSSLEHLRTTYIDSYVLHGPSVGGPALGPKDWEVWRVMERLKKEGKVKSLGISNVPPKTLPFPLVAQYYK